MGPSSPPWVTGSVGVLFGALLTGLVIHFTLSGEVAGLRADVQHLLRTQATLQQRLDELRDQLRRVPPRSYAE